MYKVPECLIGNKKGTIESDVWSLGCTLLELFTEKDRSEEQSAQKAGQVGEDIDHMGKANKIISIVKGQVTPGALQWLQSAMVGALLEKVLKTCLQHDCCNISNVIDLINAFASRS